jgi:hypothetical protein
MKAIANYLLFLSILLGIFEGASMAFWELYGVHRIPYHERVKLDLSEILAAADAWKDPLTIPDSELGWSSNPEHPSISESGTRKSKPLPRKWPISAYGDSFVYGADVADHESFPYYLSSAIGSGVRNYGVGGYGPDQAVLRLERHLREGQRPKIVVLGMPSENIARVVNVIRRLYLPMEGFQFTKPVFVAGDKGWEIANSVPEWPPTAGSATRLLETARKHDRWYGQNLARPNFEFPYSLAMLRAVAFLAFDVLRWQNLYEDRRALSTLRHVLRRFVDLSKRYGFTAVFVVIPMPEDLQNLVSGEPAFYSSFLRDIGNEFGKELLLIDVLDRKIDMARFHVKPFSGHASAYGNQLIAEAIREAIEEELGR